MKFGLTLLVAVLSAFTQTTYADQLERETREQLGPAPQGVVVKVDSASRIIEVFKAPIVTSRIRNRQASKDEVLSHIRSVETSANKIAEIKMSKNELDRDTSTQACWYGRGWNWYGYSPYTYGYNCYRPYYYPSYFNYGGYYRSGYGCGYGSNCGGYYGGYGGYNYNYGYNYGYGGYNYGLYY